MDEAFYIAARRLSLVTIPTAVLEGCTRGAASDLVAATVLDAAGTLRDIVYPADWPGDAVKMFAPLLARRRVGAPREGVLGAIVERTHGIAVGNMGTHGPPVGGRVEVGYGIVPAFEGRGYATEMLRAFTSWLFAVGGVAEVTAETVARNIGSMRVLQKNGYVRAGTRLDGAGSLVLWTRTCGA